MAQANTFAKRFAGSRFWPDRRWDLAIVLDNSAQRGAHYDELLERASWFYEAVSFSAAMKSQTPGAGQAYLGAYTDAEGDWLDGARVHPPRPGGSARQALLVGDRLRRRHALPDRQRAATRRPRLTRPGAAVPTTTARSTCPSGPAPAGGEANWVQTIPGRHWFSYFRFYGPLEAYFDRSWKLGDITPA